MSQSKSKNEIVIALVHDDGEVGSLWKKFMEEMFTVDLPENFRDMGLDVECTSVGGLDDDLIARVNQCSWKLFLLSHDMLEELKDPESTLMESGIMTTRADKVIILILGERDDTQFHDDVRRSLCVFQDFLKFNLVNATTPPKIFSDIIEIISPLYTVFHPNILSSEDRDQHVTVIANKPFPDVDGATFKVEFNDGTKTVDAEARLFNPCTLLLQNPGLSTGMIDVRAYICVREGDDENAPISRDQVGDTMKIWVQSDLDKLNSMLEKSNNPFNFLCQALKVDPNNPSAVDIADKHLTDCFRKHVPENQLTRVFGTDQGFKADGGEERSKEFAPTLLHFAAMYGLRNLTAQLLRCPGAVRAYGMANRDGDYPTNLAEKSGHWDLKTYMQSYMEVSAMVDYEIGSSRNTSEMVAQMVTGQYLSVPESVYDSNETSGSRSQPGYLAMKPLIGNAVKHYDSPFIVPIPISEDMPNYESVLVQMIESADETYMEFEPPCDDGRSFGFGYGKDAPPPPPRADVTPPPIPEEIPTPPPRLVHSSEEIFFAPPPPPTLPPTLPQNLPPERNEETSASIRRGGADRVSYGSLSIPKMHSYVSPAQRELITLQQKVKCGDLTTNQAVIRFKEWERKHKEQAASFQFQQECLQRIRNSLMKSREIKRRAGEKDEIEITKPLLAGSSTYDLVLRKTNEADPSEVIYASTTARPPRLDDGFGRSSIKSNQSGSIRSIRTSSSLSSNSSVDTARSNLYSAEYRPPQPAANFTNLYSVSARNARAPHTIDIRPPPSSSIHYPQPTSPPHPSNSYTIEPSPARPPPVPPRENPAISQPPFIPPRGLHH